MSVAGPTVQELLAAARRLEVEASSGDVDHDAVGELVDQIAGAELSADQARILHEAVSALTLTVQTRRDAVRSQLGGVAQKNRAVRGFGRTQRHLALLRGQRVNTGV